MSGFPPGVTGHEPEIAGEECRIARWAIEEVSACDVHALDLRQEIKELSQANTDVECYRVSFFDAEDRLITETADLLFVPPIGRAGLAWGADADWFDAESAEDAVKQYVSGTTFN